MEERRKPLFGLTDVLACGYLHGTCVRQIYCKPCVWLNVDCAHTTRTARNSLGQRVHKPGRVLGHRARGHLAVYRKFLHLIQTGGTVRPLRPHGLATCPAESLVSRAQSANVRTRWSFSMRTSDDGLRAAATKPMRAQRGPGIPKNWSVGAGAARLHSQPRPGIPDVWHT